MTWVWFIILGIVALMARRGIAGWVSNWRDESLKQWAIGGLIFFGLMATFGVASWRGLWFVHLAAAIGGIMGFFAVSELTGRASRRASARRLEEVRQRLEERQARRDRLSTSSMRKAAGEEPTLHTRPGSPAHVTDILALVAKRWEYEQAAQTGAQASAGASVPAEELAAQPGEVAGGEQPVDKSRAAPMRINLAVESKLGRQPAQAARPPEPPPAPVSAHVPSAAAVPPPLLPVGEEEVAPPPLTLVSEAEAPAPLPLVAVAEAEAEEQPPAEPAAEPQAVAPGAETATAARPAGPLSLGQSVGPRPSGPVSLGGPSTLVRGTGPVSLGLAGGRPSPQGPAKLERKLAYEPCLVRSRLGGARKAEEEEGEEPEAQAKNEGQAVEV